MALRTLGTTSNTALSAFSWSANPGHPADVGTLNASILNDQTTGPVGYQAKWPTPFSRQGLLFIPNRGVVQLYPGDVIAFDTQSGWPIVVSGLAISVGSSVWHLV